MEKIIQEIFDEAYKLHQEWLNDGRKGKILDFSNKNLVEIEFPNSADLRYADLRYANLSSADLSYAISLIKIVGVEPLNYYYKRIGDDFQSNGYYFTVGLNHLREEEEFAADERVLCSYPGFHFASKSWCALNYSERRYEVKVQIPKDAQINEPWATDGKASVSSIKIVQVIDTETGKDVTKKFRNYADGYGNKI